MENPQHDSVVAHYHQVADQHGQDAKRYNHLVGKLHEVDTHYDYDVAHHNNDVAQRYSTVELQDHTAVLQDEVVDFQNRDVARQDDVKRLNDDVAGFYWSIH